eukprot:gene3166-6246_t
MTQSSSKSPKDPAAIHIFYRKPLSPNDLPQDYLAMFSLLSGIIGLLTENKLLSWAALFFCFSSLSNLKTIDCDYKQIITSFGFAVMAIRVQKGLFITIIFSGRFPVYNLGRWLSRLVSMYRRYPFALQSAANANKFHVQKKSVFLLFFVRNRVESVL